MVAFLDVQDMGVHSGVDINQHMVKDLEGPGKHKPELETRLYHGYNQHQKCSKEV